MTIIYKNQVTKSKNYIQKNYRSSNNNSLYFIYRKVIFFDIRNYRKIKYHCLIIAKLN